MDQHQRKFHLALRVIRTSSRSSFPFHFNITVISYFSLDDFFINEVIHLWTVACCSQSHGIISLAGTVKCHPAWQDHIRLQRRVAACAWDRQWVPLPGSLDIHHRRVWLPPWLNWQFCHFCHTEAFRSGCTSIFLSL